MLYIGGIPKDILKDKDKYTEHVKKLISEGEWGRGGEGRAEERNKQKGKNTKHLTPLPVSSTGHSCYIRSCSGVSISQVKLNSIHKYVHTHIP